MIEKIRDRWDEKIGCFSRSFSWKDDPNAGFGFKCDKDGNIKREELHPLSQANLDFCIADAGKTLIDNGVEDYSYIIRHPVVRRCKCGRELEMYGDSMGEVGCDCGRVYNIFGQELIGFTQPFSGQNEFGEW